MELIGTHEAAERLHITPERVQKLIRDGRLPALRIAGRYVINAADLKLVENRKPGRPRKVAA